MHYFFFIFCCILVDDGTDDDHDSHIMVWQVHDTDPGPQDTSLDSPSLSLPSPYQSLSLGSETQGTIDLGPTPGSGMALDSPDDTASEVDTPPVTDTEQHKPAQDDLEWNEEVEQMLNNPPPSKFESFVVSEDPSLSTWIVPDRSSDPPHPSHSPSPLFTVEPREDFTGHLAGDK